MSEIETEFLFEARVALGDPMHVGATPDGHRMIVPVEGGRFEGPGLSGRVLPSAGADWARIRSDGVGALDVRMTLATDEGALIYVHWHGLMAFEAEDQAYALDFAKPDDPEGAARYYFRAAPRFETADPELAWLNRILAVTCSRTGGGGVVHRVFAVR